MERKCRKIVELRTLQHLKTRSCFELQNEFIENSHEKMEILSLEMLPSGRRSSWLIPSRVASFSCSYLVSSDSSHIVKRNRKKRVKSIKIKFVRNSEQASGCK